MNLIVGGRGSGKTTYLIEESDATGYYIIVRDKQTASQVFEMAIKMKKNIPFPITYEEFVDKQYYGEGISGFLLDEVISFLQYLSGRVPIYSGTLTPTGKLIRLEIPENTEDLG